MKIKNIGSYFRAFVKLLRREAGREMVKSDPSLLIASLRKAGIAIDEDTIIFDPETLAIDLTRPSLVEIKGGGTFLHKNFTLLTHDYATSVFIRKYAEFVPCSGRVYIGRNVWFGQNVTVLKGSHIGDNCIIGLGSVVMGEIPDGSVAAGCPARVICTLDEYYRKRQRVSVEEAFAYARSIPERFGRRPVPADFWEEFPLFVSGDQVELYPDIPIKRQLGPSFETWVHNHKAPYGSFEQFLKAAGL